MKLARRDIKQSRWNKLR